MSLDTIDEIYTTVWDDFTVKDSILYETEIVIENIAVSADAELTALNFGRYNPYNFIGYGESRFVRGVTEQEAFSSWLGYFNRAENNFKKQLISIGVERIPQSVYDGIFIYYWITMNFLTINAVEGTYNTRNIILNKDWSSLASMMMRSTTNRKKSRIAATIVRLADYGFNKDRSWMRATGIFNMRTANEQGILSEEQLRAARFAYYAETAKFLPFTPEGIKRAIVNRYQDTLREQQFTYDVAISQNNIEYLDGVPTITLSVTPSIEPVEKLLVKINGDIKQHYYDYTLDGPRLTIIAELVTGDIIQTSVKI